MLADRIRTISVVVLIFVLRAIGGIVGFGACLYGLGHAHYALLAAGLALTTAAGISLKGYPFSAVAEKWRIPIVMTLIVVVMMMLPGRVGS